MSRRQDVGSQPYNSMSTISADRTHASIYPGTRCTRLDPVKMHLRSPKKSSPFLVWGVCVCESVLLCDCTHEYVCLRVSKHACVYAIMCSECVRESPDCITISHIWTSGQHILKLSHSTASAQYLNVLSLKCLYIIKITTRQHSLFHTLYGTLSVKWSCMIQLTYFSLFFYNYHLINLFSAR